MPDGIKTPCLIKVEIPTNSLAQNVIQVRVPDDAQEGQYIEVTAPNGTSVRCKVPQGTSPGSTIFVEVPTAASQPRPTPLAPRQVTVRIPPNAKPGDEMQADAPDGTRFKFRVPTNAVPDSTIRVVLNSEPDSSQESLQDSEMGNSTLQASNSPALQRSPESNSKRQQQERSGAHFSRPLEASSTLSPPRAMEPTQDLLTGSPSTSITRII